MVGWGLLQDTHLYIPAILQFSPSGLLQDSHLWPQCYLAKTPVGCFARYAFVIQRCLLGSILRPLIYRRHDDNTLGITILYVVAKYPENKIVRFCAMGVFRSQTPRAL